MAIPPYLKQLRTRIGREMVFMAGVMAVVVNDAGEILFQRRSDDGQWDLPGGILEPGELPEPATIREVFEETGLHVELDHLISVYAGPDQLVTYPNGDQVLFVQFTYSAHPVGGQMQRDDDETLDVGYFPRHTLPPVARQQMLHVEQALEQLDKGLPPYFIIGAQKGEPFMAVSDYIRKLREKIGKEMLFVPGVAAIITNEAGHILLQRRSDNGEWGLPGGAIDPGEEPADAIIREVQEEVGLQVMPERIIGVYSGPEFLVTYPNGDQAMILSITFSCRIVSGEPCVNDDESLEVRYFAPDALPAMNNRNMARIQQALRGDPRTHFRTTQQNQTM